MCPRLPRTTSKQENQYVYNSIRKSHCRTCGPCSCICQRGHLLGRYRPSSDQASRRDARARQTAGLIAAFLTRVMAAYVLAIFLNYAGAQSALAGATFALVAWIGFVITISIGQAVFGWISWTASSSGPGSHCLGTR